MTYNVVRQLLENATAKIVDLVSPLQLHVVVNSMQIVSTKLLYISSYDM